MFAAALVARLLYIASVWSHPSVRYPMVDSRAYHERALEILAGDWLGDRIFYQDPVYPYFLAALYSVFGPGSPAVLVVQAGIDAGTAALVFAIANRVFGYRVGVAAGLLAVFYKVFWYYDALLLKIPLSVFAIALALAMCLRARESGRLASWGLSGAALGVAALTRGNYLLFVPVLLAWMLAVVPRPARAVASAALGLTLVIAPVTVRNAVVGGDFVLITSQAGQNFFIGNFGGAVGLYRAPPFARAHPFFEESDFLAEAERRAGREFSPSEASRFWFGETVRAIRRDPGRFVWLLWRKTQLLLGAYEVPDNQSFDFFRERVSPTLRLPFPSYGFVLPLAALGMVWARRRRDAWLLIAYAVTYALGVIAFYNMSRYRIPLVPALLVFAGFAGVELARRAVAREWRALLPAAAFLLVAYPLVHRPVIPVERAVYHHNLALQLLSHSGELRERAAALSAEGDPKAARDAFDESRALHSRAEAELRIGLDRRPGSERLRGALQGALLGRVLEHERLRELDAALAAAEALTAEFPSYPDGLARHGLLLVRRGRAEQAIPLLERALELDPEHANARRTLRRARRSQPKPARDGS